MSSIAITNNFIPAFNLQEVIVDKDTGKPLAAGIVSFYKDASRLELKDIFQITGIPGNYTVTQLPNPITLSSVGTFQDNSGNDIVPYFYPYDSTGNIEYYYITVDSSLDGIIPAVRQFTREHVPYIPDQSGGGSSSGEKNYIPNGQLLIHNNVINTGNNVSLIDGQITQNTTILAPGGFKYERSTESTAIDIIKFIKQPIEDLPDASPRYVCSISCGLPGGADSYKYFSINFANVNKFANSNKYTFAFAAKSISGNEISVLVRSNFGTGGSPEVITDIGSQTLTNTWAMYNFTFTLGSNVGHELGANNDDFFSLLISLPPNADFNYQFTDFVLKDGDTAIQSFPVTTDAEFSYQAISGSLPVPNYEGMYYYLPRVLTPNGEIYDDSDIGIIKASARDSDVISDTEILCQGQVYNADAYDARTGIPYRRLQLKWASKSGDGKCIYGNGEYFYLTCSLPPSSAEIIVTGNVVYNLTLADGAAGLATGFTFADLGGNHQVWHITTISGSLITDGSYFTFRDVYGTPYYVWMKGSDGSVDPKPTGIMLRIICNYLSTDTSQTIAIKLMAAMNGKWLELPDLRGVFIRGWANGSDNDPDRNSRIARGDGVLGDNVGTRQMWQNLSHYHTPPPQAGIYFATVPDQTSFHPGGSLTNLNVVNTQSASTRTEYSGGNQSNPINVTAMWVVKY